MTPTQNQSRPVLLYWTTFGVTFGLLFPIIGTALVCILEQKSVIEAQAAPLLWIIDTAPLFLGIAFGLVGRMHARFIRMNRELDRLVKLRTADLESKTASLFHSSKMASLGVMASGIAHEINNPLAVVFGKVQQLQRELDAEGVNVGAIRDVLARVEANVHRIAKIVKGLQAFSRSGDRDPMVEVRARAVVEACRELVRERFTRAGVKLEVVEQGEELAILGREAQICQVLVNLLHNAFDAVVHLPSAWVRIEIERAGIGVRVRVVDCGRGIPNEVTNQMMTPFYTTKGLGKGTGLGLSISRGIIEDHGGNLEYSFHNGHTSFTFEVPISQSLRSSAAA